MGKYRDIVESKKQSGNQESQKTIDPENIKSGKPENQKATKVEKNQTSIKESNKSGNLENIKSGKPESQKARAEEMVNLSIKVPRRLRQKWVAESRLRGTTLTAIISDYLKSELGE